MKLIFRKNKVKPNETHAIGGLAARFMLIAIILLAGCESSQIDTEPVFEEAWVRALPPGMKMTAGFGKLYNPGPKEIEISSFASPSFADVSLHRTELVNGVSKMREVPALSVAADTTVLLEPGGYHLMLMRPSGEIQPGQTVVLEMTLTDGRQFSFEMRVERR